jgi:hypothetical protein
MQIAAFHRRQVIIGERGCVPDRPKNLQITNFITGNRLDTKIGQPIMLYRNAKKMTKYYIYNTYAAARNRVRQGNLPFLSAQQF